MNSLHTLAPNWILFHNQELMGVREKIWPLFLNFCLQRNPLPEFDGTFAEKQRKIADYFVEHFTREKDLAIRWEDGRITGLVLFDPQNYSIEGEPPDRSVALVIAASSSKSPWKDKRDFGILVSAYKNHKGCEKIIMNINRQWKRGPFEKFCALLGFKRLGGNLYEV